MKASRFTKVLFLGLGVSLVFGLGTAQADPPGDCCLPGGIYGDGSAEVHTVPQGKTLILIDDVNYQNLTVSEGATVITAGHTIRVCGTLTNYGLITASGGEGGYPGAGGRGGDPCDDTTDKPTEPEEGGYAGVGLSPGVSGAGSGGNGGGGGGGGGGGKRREILLPPLPCVDADGGNGGDGGEGGRGGGLVKIYAWRLANYGVIEADGNGGLPGEDGEEGQHHWWVEIDSKDLAGGGGGGGEGGDGGDGGTVEVYYAYLLSDPADGEVHAHGGTGGAGGQGGDGHCLWYGVMGLYGSRQPGADGWAYAGNGGDGEWEEDFCSQVGEEGDDGAKGVDGTASLIPWLFDCNGNGMPDEYDIAIGASEDCNDNGVPDECDIVVSRYRSTELGKLVRQHVYAHAVNNLGQAVGGAAVTTSDTWPYWAHPFLWLPGYAYDSPPGLHDLGVLGDGWWGHAYDINDVGQVVGWSNIESLPFPHHAWVWQNGVMTELQVPGSGSIWSAAEAINNHGHIAGWADIPGGGDDTACVWVNGDWIDLGRLGGNRSRAMDVNDADQVVGWSETPDGERHAFLLNPDGDVWYRDDNGDGANDLMIDLGLGEAYGINQLGQAVGRSSGAAVTWDVGQLATTLCAGIAYAINDAGQIVGKSHGRSFLWEDDLLWDLTNRMAAGIEVGDAHGLRQQRDRQNRGRS